MLIDGAVRIAKELLRARSITSPPILWADEGSWILELPFRVHMIHLYIPTQDKIQGFDSRTDRSNSSIRSDLSFNSECSDILVYVLILI